MSDIYGDEVDGDPTPREAVAMIIEDAVTDVRRLDKDLADLGINTGPIAEALGNLYAMVFSLASVVGQLGDNTNNPTGISLFEWVENNDGS